MGTFETIPLTLQNKQFPIGDIGEFEYEKTKNWLHDFDPRPNENMTVDERITAGRYIICKLNLAMDFSTLQSDKATHQSAVQLCEIWDKNAESVGRNVRCAYIGYKLSRMLVSKAHFLPRPQYDYSQELANIAYAPESDPEVFSTNAWKCMQKHERVYDIHHRLYQMGSEILEYDEPDFDNRLRAGMAIPYLVASVSRLWGYGSRASAMCADDISKENFLQSIIKGPSLAHDDPKRRL